MYVKSNVSIKHAEICFPYFHLPAILLVRDAYFIIRRVHILLQQAKIESL